MALSSTSTRAEVIAAIKNNLRYAANDSVSEARDLIEALDHYITFYAPRRATDAGGGAEIELDTTQAADIRDKASRWLQGGLARAGSGGGRYFSLSDFRI